MVTDGELPGLIRERGSLPCCFYSGGRVRTVKWRDLLRVGGAGVEVRKLPERCCSSLACGFWSTCGLLFSGSGFIA